MSHSTHSVVRLNPITKALIHCLQKLLEELLTELLINFSFTLYYENPDIDTRTNHMFLLRSSILLVLCSVQKTMQVF